MARWESRFFLDAESTQPIFLQVCEAIISDIERGRLRPGDLLPGYRALAESLGVNRNTVLAAYQELTAEGWVTAQSNAGTRVSAKLPKHKAAAPNQHLKEEGLGFELRSYVEKPWKLPEPPVAFALASGTPDPRVLPSAALARAYHRAMKGNRQEALRLEDPLGHPRLRKALRNFISSQRGLAAEEDQILVTRGSQMAVFLVAQALLEQGACVAVEALGHRPHWDAVTNAGATLAPIPVDSEGMRVDVLESLLANRQIRAVVVTPQRQYPSLAVLSPERRHHLLSLARTHRFAIVEIDHDSEFQYDGTSPIPLAGEDKDRLVIHIGTMSKIFSPNLRLGFLHAPRAFIEHLYNVRRTFDRQGDLVLEMAMAELLEDGEVQRHLNRMRKLYLTRRDAFAEALGRHLSGTVRFALPSGGLAFWLETDPSVNVQDWSSRCLTRGVRFRPGEEFTFDRTSIPNLRIGFSSHAEPELQEAALRMAEALPSLRH